ncbi:hypothetical protein Hanom_Chr00s000020g01616841 [Helianthus anomalus]
MALKNEMLVYWDWWPLHEMTEGYQFTNYDSSQVNMWQVVDLKKKSPTNSRPP